MRNFYRKLLLVFLISGITLTIILNSCKKNENNSITKEEEAGIEKIKQNIRQQTKELGGIPQKIELNQRMKIGYADMNGEIVQRPQAGTANRVLSACGGEDDQPDYLDLAYYYRLYQCGVGYYIRFGWTISWDNNVVLENPFNSSNKTKGTIKVSIPGNSNAYNNTTYNVEIINLGVDPNNSSNNIFLVEMTSSSIISKALVETPGATLRLGGFFASDCESLENYSVIPLGVTGYGYWTPLDSDACTRNDKVWFQLPGNVGYRQIGVCGADPLFDCDYDILASGPTFQQVDYSLDDGVNWTPFYNYTSIYTSIRGTGFLATYDFGRSATLSPGTYNMKIRYRNIKYTKVPTPPAGTLPDASNSCGTNTWSTPLWTIESFHGVVVN